MLNFEQHYFIPNSRAEYNNYIITPQHVKRRGIYKDTYRATHEHCDYYLRPNSCVAISIAPELFSINNADLHLEQVRDVLLVMIIMMGRYLSLKIFKNKGAQVFWNQNLGSKCGMLYAVL